MHPATSYVETAKPDKELDGLERELAFDLAQGEGFHQASTTMVHFPSQGLTWRRRMAHRANRELPDVWEQQRAFLARRVS